MNKYIPIPALKIANNIQIMVEIYFKSVANPEGSELLKFIHL